MPTSQYEQLMAACGPQMLPTSNVRCGCSSLSHTVVPCAADIVGPLHTALAVAIGYICAMHEERPKKVAASEMFVVG